MKPKNANNQNNRDVIILQVKVSHNLSLTLNPILLPKLSINSNSNIVEHFNFIPSDLSNGDIVIVTFVLFDVEDEDMNVG